MRLIDMQTFVALARNRHFGRTAEELNITQPAISSRLAAVERELSCRLIERGEGRFALTSEGERALLHFEVILEDLEILRDEITEGEAHAPGPLRLGAIDSVSSTWMPSLIDSLHHAYPNLKIELTVDGTKPLVAGMRKGDYDMIFCLHPVLDEGFRSYTACIFQMTWAGSPRLIDPDRIYSVANLGMMPIISFPKDSPPYQMVAPYFHDEQVLASKLTSCNSLYAIINLMIDGFGVGAVPSVTISRELRANLLHPIKVSKRFPPMPIIASYQATGRHDFIRTVVRKARAAAEHYCQTVNPEYAWTD